MSYGLNDFACFIFWQRQARSRLRRETCEWMSLAEAGLGKFKAHLTVNCQKQLLTLELSGEKIIDA